MFDMTWRKKMSLGFDRGFFCCHLERRERSLLVPGEDGFLGFTSK
jgi:hypothetical protein